MPESTALLQRAFGDVQAAAFLLLCGVPPGVRDHRLPGRPGEDLAFDVKTTNPSTRIYRDTDLESAICPLAGLQNGEVLLTGELRQPHFEVVIDDGVTPLKASGDLQLCGRSGRSSAPLIDLSTEQAVADLSIGVDLTKIGRRQQESASVDGVTERVARVPYRASISVTTTDGRSGTADCYAEYVGNKIIIRPGAGTGDE